MLTSLPAVTCASTLVNAAGAERSSGDVRAVVEVLDDSSPGAAKL